MTAASPATPSEWIRDAKTALAGGADTHAIAAALIAIAEAIVVAAQSDG